MPSAPRGQPQPSGEQDLTNAGQSFRQSFRDNIKTYTDRSARHHVALGPRADLHTEDDATRSHRRHQRGMASRDAGHRS